MKATSMTLVRWPALALAAIVGASALFSVSCASEGEPEAETPARSIAVTMSDLAFEPSEMMLARGERVELRLSNQGSMEHDFTVDQMPMSGMRMSGGMGSGEHAGHGGGGAALHMALAAGSAGTLDFEATEAGRYEYYCTVEGHRAAGMAGMFVVE
jgi:uncharacterized cupredoxin-like copper-binding protein